MGKHRPPYNEVGSKGSWDKDLAVNSLDKLHADDNFPGSVVSFVAVIRFAVAAGFALG